MPTLSDIFAAIAEVARETKIPAYAVGGFVRDLLLSHRVSKDVDVVVEGSGISFAQAFDAQQKQVGRLVTFADFDTARYLFSEEGQEPVVIEFAGARSESYLPESRKPKVAHTDLAGDLSRRDFTINAMALSAEVLARIPIDAPELLTHIIDPLQGQNDLQEKILRTPLDPDTIFSDDPLRMLRAARFAAQLEFAIDPDTLAAMHRNRERLQIVSAERIKEELWKMMGTKKPSIGLTFLWQTGLLDVVLPEISNLHGVTELYGHQHKDNLIHTFQVVDNIALYSDKPMLRLAGLLHDIGKPATKQFEAGHGWTFHAHEHVGKKMVYQFARRLKCSKEETDYLAQLVRWHLQPIALMDEGITDSAVRRLVVTMGELLPDLMILGASDITTGNPYKKKRRLENYARLQAKIQEVIEKDKLRAFQSPFRGEEIMTLCALKPGPTVGKIKKAIEEAILEGIIPNDHDAAQEYCSKIKDGYLKDVADWERVTQE